MLDLEWPDRLASIAGTAQTRRTPNCRVRAKDPTKLRPKFRHSKGLLGPAYILHESSGLAACDERGVIQRRHEADPRISLFSPDGRLIAAVLGDNKIILVDAANGESRGSLQSGHGRTNSLAFSPDGKTLATGTDESSVISLWDVRTRQELGTLNARLAVVRTLAFSPDGSRLLAAGQAEYPLSRRGMGQVVEWVLPETK